MYRVRFGWMICGVFVLLSGFVFVPVVFAEQAEAASAITSAEQQIVTCFEAASEAEGMGANIASLTAILNEAGLLLSNAEFAYSRDDYDSALDLAVQSRARLEGFVSETNDLVVSTIGQRTTETLIGVVGSAAASVVILSVGLVVWGRMKSRYFRQVLDSEPVVEGEE